MAFDPSSGEWPTIANLTKLFDPDGGLADVGEVFTYANEFMQDMPMVEANGKTYHRITIEDGLPSGTWRRLNKGIKPVDSGTLQVDETIGLLEARSEVDLVLARMSGDIPKYRKRKDDAIVRGIAKQMADTVLYGDTATYPDRFHGLHPRYDVVGKKTDSFSAFNPMAQVYDFGASGSALTSIWLIGWAEDKVYGVYPQGSPAGLEQEDLGIIDAFDADGGKFRAYSTLFRMQMGLAVEDWRYVTRLANIDVAAVTIGDTAMTTLLNNLIDMSNAIPDLNMCRPAFYMNRNVKSMMEKLVYTKSNLALNIGEVYGKKNVLNIGGIPIRTADSITLTETELT